jgi:hypothetical protein
MQTLTSDQTKELFASLKETVEALRGTFLNYQETKTGSDRVATLESKIELNEAHLNKENALSVLEWTRLMRFDLTDALLDLTHLEKQVLELLVN